MNNSNIILWMTRHHHNNSNNKNGNDKNNTKNIFSTKSLKLIYGQPTADAWKKLLLCLIYLKGNMNRRKKKPTLKKRAAAKRFSVDSKRILMAPPLGVFYCKLAYFMLSLACIQSAWRLKLLCLRKRTITLYYLSCQSICLFKECQSN